MEYRDYLARIAFYLLGFTGTIDLLTNILHYLLIHSTLLTALYWKNQEALSLIYPLASSSCALLWIKDPVFLLVYVFAGLIVMKRVR